MHMIARNLLKNLHFIVLVTVLVTVLALAVTVICYRVMQRDEYVVDRIVFTQAKVCCNQVEIIG